MQKNVAVVYLANATLRNLRHCLQWSPSVSASCLADRSPVSSEGCGGVRPVLDQFAR